MSFKCTQIPPQKRAIMQDPPAFLLEGLSFLAENARAATKSRPALFRYPGPGNGFAYAQHGGVELERLGAFEVAVHVNLDAALRVVDLGSVPALLFGVVLEALDEDDAVRRVLRRLLSGFLVSYDILPSLSYGLASQ